LIKKNNNLIIYSFLKYIKIKFIDKTKEKEAAKKEEFKYHYLMNKTVDETIRKWKLELDTQSESFEKNCQNLMQFEFKFLKNFESVY
jgi:hypothetical protein